MFVAPDKKDAIFFDVDSTLVEWVHCSFVDERKDVGMNLQPGSGHLHFPIVEHIEELKKLKAEGNTIMVWSQGGSEWAGEVVRALGLEEFVDVCLTKPHEYFDDLLASDWMPTRSFLGPLRLKG